MPRVKVKTKHVKNSYWIKRHGWALGSLVLLTLSVALFAGLLQTRPPADDQNIVAVVKKGMGIRTPKDDGPHSVITEWWYYNGHLETMSGRRFSYHYTIFAHRAVAEHSIVHATLLDHETMKTYSFERRLPSLITEKLKSNGFKIGSSQWTMTLENGQDQLTGKAPDFSFDLQLQSPDQIVLQDDDGLLDFGEAGESYYYSRPRMATQGGLTLDGRTYQVTGESWFDHQWGEFSATVLNWNWFALQLDDGSDIMLFGITDFGGKEVFNGGTYSRNGQTIVFDKAAFDLREEGYWTSEKTKMTYPIDWTLDLRLPTETISVNLNAVKRASEFDARNSTYSVYWEGPIAISGSHSGKGFLEVSKANATAKAR